MSKHIKPVQLKRLSGVVCISMGAGMLLVLLMPGWGFLIAAVLVVVGCWKLFFC